MVKYTAITEEIILYVVCSVFVLLLLMLLVVVSSSSSGVVVFVCLCVCKRACYNSDWCVNNSETVSEVKTKNMSKPKAFKCSNKQHSFEPFMCLDIVLER